MKIIELSFESDYIFASVQGVTNDYCCRIDDEGFSCSCQDNALKHSRDNFYTCKHLDLVLNKIYKSENLINLETYNNNRGKNSMTFLKTDLRCLNELFGGIPKKILFSLVGMPESGKTTMLVQLLYHILYMSQMKIKNGDELGIVFIDGEGGIYEYMANHWINIFNKKYDADFGVDLWHINYENWEKQKEKSTSIRDIIIHKVDSKKKLKFHVIDLVDGEDGILPVFKLNLLTGIPSRIATSDGGQELLKAHPRQDQFRNIKKTYLGRFIADNHIVAFGLDSLTMIMETAFSSGTESFPARAKNNMKVCNQLLRIAMNFDLYGIVNHHVSQNPQQGNWAVPAMTGGKGTRHPSKEQALLTFYGGMVKPHASKRWMSILRSQIKPRGLVKLPFEITSNGIIDIIIKKKEK